MLVQYYLPAALSKARLDRYLAAGWFRNGAMMYRSKLICLDDDFHTVINVRLPLRQFVPKKRHRRLLRQNQARFRVDVGRASFSEAKEALYQQHKHRFYGFVYNDLYHCLYAEQPELYSVFDTYEITVYDGDRLVAVSFFDVGEKSIASLLALHDQTYAPYSLGIYTMLLEIEFARLQDLRYYYPGYILDHSPAFDYKLSLGNMEYYDWRGRWRPADQLNRDEWMGTLFKKSLLHLQTTLNQHNIPHQFHTHPLFSIGFIQKNYLPAIAFFNCYPDHDLPDQLIVWIDPATECYHLCTVRSQTVDTESMNITVSKQWANSAVTNLYLLSMRELLFSSTDLVAVIARLLSFAPA